MLGNFVFDHNQSRKYDPFSHSPTSHSFFYLAKTQSIYKFREWQFKTLDDPIKQKANWGYETNVKITII